MSEPKITGTCIGKLDVKRFHMPGIRLEQPCPKCEAPFVREFAEDYLSDPCVGKPEYAYGYCNKCDHEWPIMVIVRVTLELAPA